eukprot:TRINITY_DN7898_c0_g1_i1.p1 TRINITY_DN7898_c0_g1~~TRINITY_DN7898_c0_g1_i1.p1  ORF type:complete len:261 (-),score=65.74 TRINITY_DN7898_c0_g1_i1:282-1064(-)
MCIRDSCEVSSERLLCPSLIMQSRAARASIEASQILTLRMIAPIHRTLKAHTLDTVGTLLSMAAETVGLDQRHGRLLQLLFSDEPVKDHDLTLEAIGMCEDAAFELQGDFARIHREAPAANKLDLNQAVKEGAFDDVASVLRYYPERIRQRDRDGYLALQIAAINGAVEMAGLLLEAGAELNARSRDGVTALGLAFFFNRVDVARVVLKAGADLELESEECMVWALRCAGDCVRFSAESKGRGSKRTVQQQQCCTGAACF